jgi:hypothetical protein
MMKAVQPIQPYDQITVKVIYGFDVEVNTVILNTSARLSVRLYDQNNTIVNVQTMELTGEDYSNWNNDDQYIINKVAEKLGFIMVTSTPNPTINPTPGLIVNSTPDPIADPIVDPTPDPVI